MKRIHTSSRYRRVLAVAFTSALLSAPAASARPDPDGAGSVQPPAQLVTADTFDWADAGIGAGSVAALLLALAVAFARRNRSERTFQQAHGEVS